MFSNSQQLDIPANFKKRRAQNSSACTAHWFSARVLDLTGCSATGCYKDIGKLLLV